MTKLRKLLVDDGSWQKICDNWGQQCVEASEDFGQFESVRLTELKRLAGSDERGGVYVLDVSDYPIMCFLNHTGLPGYDGLVLRMRHMTMCPAVDFGEYEQDPLDAYVSLLTNLLDALIEISDKELPAKHIKMHLRSPVELLFFSRLGTHLSATNGSLTAQKKGAWLYITKT